MTDVVITRTKAYPAEPGSGPEWMWWYRYRINGTTYDFGPNLEALQSFLKRAYGTPGSTSWE